MRKINVLSSATKVFHALGTRGRLGRSGIRVSVAGALSAMVAACVHSPQTMYDWQSYQPTVYSYLVDETGDYAAQAQALEHNIETSRATDTVLPPGFRAHLGLLYLKMGHGAKAMEQFEGEKLAFPESEPFMDFVMRNSTTASTVSSSDENGTWPRDKPVPPSASNKEGA